MENSQNEDCEISDFLDNEIQIKSEPFEISEDSCAAGSNTFLQGESSTFELPIKQEDENVSNSDSEELEPISAVDVPAVCEMHSDSGPLRYVRGLGRRTLAATRLRMKRALETEEQRSERLRKERERVAQRRALERLHGSDQRRLQQQRERVALRRSQMSLTERLRALRRERNYKRVKRMGARWDAAAAAAARRTQGSQPACTICGVAIASNEDFAEHVMTHFHQKSFSCEFCGKGFAYEYDLTEHKIGHINTSKTFKCDVCSSQYLTWKDLFNHCKTVHNSNGLTVKCDVCQETFADKKLLRNHKKTHKKELEVKRKILCEVCGKFISCPQSFQNHYRLHTGEKPFVCKECGKAFAAPVGLYLHNNVHSKTKSHKCETCGKRFALSSTLSIHMKLHKSEKPFRCKLCEKSYVTKAILNVHMKNKHKSVL